MSHVNVVFHVSVCQSVCRSVWLSVYPFACLWVCLSVCPYVCVCVSVYLPLPLLSFSLILSLLARFSVFMSLWLMFFCTLSVCLFSFPVQLPLKPIFCSPVCLSAYFPLSSPPLTLTHFFSSMQIKLWGQESILKVNQFGHGVAAQFNSLLDRINEESEEDPSLAADADDDDDDDEVTDCCSEIFCIYCSSAILSADNFLCLLAFGKFGTVESSWVTPQH